MFIPDRFVCSFNRALKKEKGAKAYVFSYNLLPVATNRNEGRCFTKADYHLRKKDLGRTSPLFVVERTILSRFPHWRKNFFTDLSFLGGYFARGDFSRASHVVNALKTLVE